MYINIGIYIYVYIYYVYIYMYIYNTVYIYIYIIFDQNGGACPEMGPPKQVTFGGEFPWPVLRLPLRRGAATWTLTQVPSWSDMILIYRWEFYRSI